MKKLIIFSALLFSVCTVTFAQTNSETAIKQVWQSVYEAFNSGNTEKGFTYYTETALEIGPDGTLLSGKKAIRENWAAFMKMLDEKPKFNYSNPAVNIITADVAIITWNSNDEMKIQGQQIGGKMQGMAIVHKINGKWLIEADALIPVMQQPDSAQAQAAKN